MVQGRVEPRLDTLSLVQPLRFYLIITVLVEVHQRIHELLGLERSGIAGEGRMRFLYLYFSLLEYCLS